jgi:hypothetical protein
VCLAFNPFSIGGERGQPVVSANKNAGFLEKRYIPQNFCEKKFEFNIIRG